MVTYLAGDVKGKVQKSLQTIRPPRRLFCVRNRITVATMVLGAWLPIAHGQPARPMIHGGLPSVSPDGSRIAFISNRDGADDVYVIAADGTGEVQLTHTAEQKSPPAWTVNRQQVLFSVSVNETSHLYSIDPDGKNQREIGSVKGRSPALSPDGKRIVYSVDPYPVARLMVAELDGTHGLQLSDGSSPVWLGRWSPDGKQIAFTWRDKSGASDVWIMNADGTERRQISHIPAAEGHVEWPVWSPDGRQLAVQVGRYSKQENTAHIWIVDAATGAAHKLAAHDQPYLDETPSWFPDGKRIAFQSNRTGRVETWTMNVDGSAPRQVTH